MAPEGTYCSVGLEVLIFTEKRSLDTAAPLVSSVYPPGTFQVRNVRIQ
jgi:hypothetical protein